MKRTVIASISLILALTATAAATDPLLLHPTKLAAKAPSRYDAVFKTTAGNFTIAVTRAWSPRGADRFYNLVKHGFYNGAEFFRVVPGFVVQFGLNGSAAVNAAWSGARIPDDPVKQTNDAGYVSFASAGPNTRTTQVFINLGNNARLDSMGFSPFGKVTSGMNAVEKIYAGYRESPDQDQITAKGNAYLQKAYPKLDRIVSATVTAAH